MCPNSSKRRIRSVSGLEVTPEYLESTIHFLRQNNYELVSLSRAAQILNTGDNIKKKFAVFTFDDGYADNYLHAYPIFKKYEVPFTIYVTTQLPDGDAILWWYLLEELILNENLIEFEFSGRQYQFSCDNFWKKESTYHDIHRLILNGPIDDFNERIQQIFKNYNNINFQERTSNLALSWQQIREMSEDQLVEIGAHTINHPSLNKLSEAAVQKEMEGSRDRIESEIGKKVEHFCYPFGTRNEIGEREFRIAKQCGFKTSTTTSSANIFSEHKNFLERLPRIAINQKRDNGDINYLALWLNGVLPCILNKFKRIV